MNFDRNTIIGFVILALLFMGFFYYNSQQQAAYQKERARQDSIEKAKKPLTPVPAANGTAILDTSVKVVDSSDLGKATMGTEQISYLENDLIRVAFTNKGGQPKWVELKKFKGPDSTNVKLASSAFDKISYDIIPGQNKTADITSFYFTPDQPVKNSDGSQTINFRLAAGNGATIVHQFVIRPNYLVDFHIILQGAAQLFQNNTLFLHWQNRALKLQKDLSYERQQSQVCYRVNGEYDHSSALSSSSEEFKKPVNWVA